MKTRRTVHVDIQALSARLGQLQTKVGWFESAEYPDGTPVALIAAVQEYGSPGKKIPPRPFLRPTIAAEVPKWKKIIKDGTTAMLKGKLSPEQVMEGVGLQAQGDFKRTIAKLTTPALADSTIRGRKRKVVGKKGEGEKRSEYSAKVDAASVSEKPLNDTGYMLATLLTQTEEK